MQTEKRARFSSVFNGFFFFFFPLLLLFSFVLFSTRFPFVHVPVGRSRGCVWFVRAASTRQRRRVNQTRFRTRFKISCRKWRNWITWRSFRWTWIRWEFCRPTWPTSRAKSNVSHTHRNNLLQYECKIRKFLYRGKAASKTWEKLMKGNKMLSATPKFKEEKKNNTCETVGFD